MDRFDNTKLNREFIALVKSYGLFNDFIYDCKSFINMISIRKELNENYYYSFMNYAFKEKLMYMWLNNLSSQKEYINELIDFLKVKGVYSKIIKHYNFLDSYQERVKAFVFDIKNTNPTQYIKTFPFYKHGEVIREFISIKIKRFEFLLFTYNFKKLYYKI